VSVQLSGGTLRAIMTDNETKPPASHPATAHYRTTLPACRQPAASSLPRLLVKRL